MKKSPAPSSASKTVAVTAAKKKPSKKASVATRKMAVLKPGDKISWGKLPTVFPKSTIIKAS